MTWKHVFLSLAVVAVCVAGTVRAESLDPSVVEAALGNGTGTYLDVNMPGNTWTRNGISATTDWGTWFRGPAHGTGGPEGWAPTIQVDGNGNGAGDGWYVGYNKSPSGQFRLNITGKPNAVYDVYIVGVARDDILDMGLRWGPSNLDSAAPADDWVNLRTAANSTQITFQDISGIYDLYGVKGSVSILASSAGQRYIYIDENCVGVNTNSSWLDGVLIEQQELGLDPAVVEAAVGGGIYLDVAATPYTRGGLTGTATGAWSDIREFDPSAAWCMDSISVDGTENGRGDSLFTGTDAGEIVYDVTGLIPGATYKVWGVGVAREDGAAQGFSWGTASGGAGGDVWTDLITADGSVAVTDETIQGVYDSYAVPGTTLVTADAGGNLTLYLNDTIAAGSLASQIDGVVLQVVPEPSSLVLLIGLGILCLVRRIRR
ncbi:MAG: PEP-CTERM sorting domain-containing protein [Pirellulales bacterium]|nr:PEP-CTERM sorting domain-containing protein [Pirellulales bacterium]